jgi:hypothetical protein
MTRLRERMIGDLKLRNFCKRLVITVALALNLW